MSDFVFPCSREVFFLAKVIVADENEGRRTLLANTLEREGFDITRAGTLRQAEGTALATMPEIVLMDGEWKSGDAIDASQRLMSDPEFAFKCRIVVLSRVFGFRRQSRYCRSDC